MTPVIVGPVPVAGVVTASCPVTGVVTPVIVGPVPVAGVVTAVPVPVSFLR